MPQYRSMGGTNESPTPETVMVRETEADAVPHRE